MPEAEQLEKATLQEIRWDRGGRAEEKDARGAATQPFTVQFNPQTLKVNYSNQKTGGDQPQGSAVQFVGKGATKLTLELWFDTSVGETDGRAGTDVRALVEKVNAFMRPSPAPGARNRNVPPGVRFQWGAFLFEGVMDSMDETLELFSSGGVPLRASVSVTLSKQEIQFNRRNPGGDGAPGTRPLDQARAGESVQQVAARAGNPDWKGVAMANGIENPRRLAPGTLLDTGAGGKPAPRPGAAPGPAGPGGALRPGGGLGFAPPGAGGGAAGPPGLSPSAAGAALPRPGAVPPVGGA